MPDFSRFDKELRESRIYIGDDHEELFHAKRLAGLIRVVSNIFMGDTDAQIETQLRTLDEEYETKGEEGLGDEWKRSAYQCLQRARTAMSNDPDRYSDFDRKYESWVERISPEFGGILTPAGPVPTEAIAEPAHTDLRSDLMAASLYKDTHPQAAADTIVPALFIMEKHFTASADAGIKKRLTGLREEYESGFIDSKWLDSAFTTLEDALNVMDPQKLSALDQDLIRAQRHVTKTEIYSSEYNEMQSSLPRSKMLSRELTDVEKKQAKDVEVIRNVYARMKAEKNRFHRNSKEYEEMMECARDIDDYVRSSQYDPSDKASRDIMKIKQEKLFHAADTYAKKEVYGKRKSTSRGIERKNDALLLMEFSAMSVTMKDGALSGYAMVNEDAIKDYRRDKSDKTRRTFSELIAEEKEANRRRFGTELDKTKRPERERLKKGPSAQHTAGI